MYAGEKRGMFSSHDEGQKHRIPVPSIHVLCTAEVAYIPVFCLLVVGACWPSAARGSRHHRLTMFHGLYSVAHAHRWSCGNITLLGDACHPATPNNGQGACMAIEDALVLATLLGEYWEQPDGHVEAFYLYEVRDGGFSCSACFACFAIDRTPFLFRLLFSQIFTIRRSSETLIFFLRSSLCVLFHVCVLQPLFLADLSAATCYTGIYVC